MVGGRQNSSTRNKGPARFAREEHADREADGWHLTEPGPPRWLTAPLDTAGTPPGTAMLQGCNSACVSTVSSAGEPVSPDPTQIFWLTSGLTEPSRSQCFRPKRVAAFPRGGDRELTAASSWRSWPVMHPV